MMDSLNNASLIYSYESSVDTPCPSNIFELTEENRTAFGLAWQAASPRIERVLLRLVRDPLVVDEAMSTAVLNAWKAYSNGKFRADANMPAWFTAIAKNAALSLVTRNREHRVDAAQLGFRPTGQSEPGGLGETGDYRGLDAAWERLMAKQGLIHPDPLSQVLGLEAQAYSRLAMYLAVDEFSNTAKQPLKDTVLHVLGAATEPAVAANRKRLWAAIQTITQRARDLFVVLPVIVSNGDYAEKAAQAYSVDADNVRAAFHSIKLKLMDQ